MNVVSIAFFLGLYTAVDIFLQSNYKAEQIDQA